MTKMKAGVYYGPRDLRVEKVEIPEVGPNDVLLKVKACGICGSDLHSYKIGAYVEKGQIMGHEYCGEVVEVGANIEDVEVGERATGFSTDYCGECYWCKNEMYGLCPELFNKSTAYGKPGAYAEYVLLDNAMPGINFFKIPDKIDDLSAATLEPTAVGVFTANQINPEEGDKVVILGAGLIGNATLQALKTYPIGKAVVSEISPLRRKMAKKMGADVVIDAINENVLERSKEEVGVGPYHFHGGEKAGAMADVVVEAAGVPETIWDSFEIVRSAGTIAFVGLPEESAKIDTTKIVHKQPRILGCLGGNFIKAIELVKKGDIKTGDLVTHTFKLDNIEEAFKTQMNPSEAIKVVITP